MARKSITRICPQCRNEFQVYPSRIKAGKGLFCSAKCYHLSTRKYRICQWCGNTYKPTGAKKYCSYKCSHAADTLDLTGQVFGRLRVIGPAERTRNNETAWYCQCSCGNVCIKPTRSLRVNNIRSCGCLKRENKANWKHGQRRNPIYKCWHSMIQRCTNPNNSSYADYGGRGITVCERWQHFMNFYADMGERPLNMTLDRVDNNGPYSPENCRWATTSEQSRNTRHTRMITFNGRTQCLQDWATEIGISHATIASRLKRGKTVGEALGLA
jgi:hypothetical protein